MTKLEKEAEDYAEKHAFRVPYDNSNKFYDDVDFKASKEGYLAGAEPREKRIAELEAQIEKIKQDLDNARENANRQEQCEIYSVLNDIYNDNFEVITSVSN